MPSTFKVLGVDASGNPFYWTPVEAVRGFQPDRDNGRTYYRLDTAKAAAEEAYKESRTQYIGDTKIQNPLFAPNIFVNILEITNNNQSITRWPEEQTEEQT